MAAAVPDAGLVQRLGQHFGVPAVIVEVCLDLGHSLGGKDSGCAPLHDVGHPVELGGLAAEPELVQLQPFPLQLVGHHGVAAAGAGEARDLGEGADLDGAPARPLHFKDAAGQALLRDKALIGCVVEDDGVVGQGIVHPLLELGAVVGGAGGIVGAANVDDIGVHRGVGHGQEVILPAGGGIDHLAAVGDVVIHIGGVDGVGHQDGVVRIEQAQDVGQVALGAVADKDLAGLQLDAPARIIALDGLAQEIVALLGAVAVEAFGGAHLLDGGGHGLHHAFGQGTGDIPDAHADDVAAGMGLLVLGHPAVDLHKEIAFLQFAVMMVHLHSQRVLSAIWWFNDGSDAFKAKPLPHTR